jgi:hypothetical protein
VSAGIAAGVVVLVLALIVYRMGAFEGSYEPTAAISKAYFSDDDGATWFADDRAKVPPFERNGKTAHGAEMFTCDGGKTLFVGWLRRYTPEAKKRREQMAQRATGQSPTIFGEMEDPSGVEIKKPKTGEKGWVRQTDPSAEQVRDVKCPDGSVTNLEPAPPPEG